MKMAFETPLLVVSRPVAACSRCKTAKTKCDGKLPSCTACERAGKAGECSNRTDDEFARGRERSYVATLEARIEKLKYRLAQSGKTDYVASLQRPPSGASSRPPSAQDDYSSPPPGAGGPRFNAKAAKRKEQEDIESLVSNFGVLTVNAAARDFHGFTNTMSYARLVLAAAVIKPHPEELVAALIPSRSEMIRITSHYFQGIYTVLPFFDEANFWRALDQLYSSIAHPHIMRPAAWDLWMVRMVAAVGLISQSERYMDAFHVTAITHLKAALEFAGEVINPGTVQSVQAMILLLQYARYDPCHFNDWTLMGIVTRAMADLGLHQDPPKSSETSRSAKLLLRRRVYFTIYCLDRSTSIAYDRAFSFSDDSANVSFPMPTPPSPRHQPSPELNIGKQILEGLRSLVSLRRIQSHIYQDLHQSGREPWAEPYHYTWQKWHEISHWQLQSPQQFHQWAVVLATIEQLTTYLFLLAPSPRVPFIEELAQSLIFEYGVEYAEMMQAAIKEPTCRSWVQHAEAIKALKIGRLFVRNLGAFRSRLLAGSLPNVRSSLQHNSITPPPFPYSPRSDNLERSLTFIQRMTEILDVCCTRFGDNKLLRDFTQETRDMVIELSSQSPTDWRGSFSFASYTPTQLSN